MPSMAHVGIPLPHLLTFSSADLAQAQAGVDPTVHLRDFCTWTAKCPGQSQRNHVNGRSQIENYGYETPARLLCPRTALSALSRGLPPAGLHWLVCPPMLRFPLLSLRSWPQFILD